MFVIFVGVSEGSRLPCLGVTYPTPSTAIGMMNSLGLFLIGSDLDGVEGAVDFSVSVSTLLPRGTELSLKIHIEYFFLSTDQMNYGQYVQN